MQHIPVTNESAPSYIHRPPTSRLFTFYADRQTVDAPDNDHALRYFDLIQPGSTEREGQEHRGRPAPPPVCAKTLRALQLLAAAAEDDCDVPLAYFEEAFQEALFESEQVRYKKHGVDFGDKHYVPQVDPITGEYLTFSECYVHKFKLVTVSIATADMPLMHAVNREYLMLISQHYPEFSRFVPLLRGDFDKQNEALLALGYMRTVFRHLHFCELHICLRESRTLIYRPCTRRYAMTS